MPNPLIGAEVRGLDELQKDIERLRKFLPLAHATRIRLGLIVVSRIKERTLSGKDAQNKQFEPYSDNYKLTREDAGRRTSPVNLFWSGHMLGAIAVDSPQNKLIRLFFRAPAEGLKAHGHTFGSSKTNLPQREFFALNRSDIDEMIRYLEKERGKIL